MTFATTSLHPDRAETAIERAVRLAGGPTSLARALQARGHKRVNSHSTVGQWVATNSVPAKYCPDIEEITGVPCEDLDGETKWGIVRGRAYQNPHEAAAQDAR